MNDMTDTTDLAWLRERYVRTGSEDHLREYVDAVSARTGIYGPERARFTASMRVHRDVAVKKDLAELDRLWDEVMHADPLDPEPDDEPDEDVSQFYDRTSGEALRGFMSAVTIVFAVIMLVLAFRTEPLLGKIAASVLFGGAVYVLVGIWRGGDRG